MQPASSASVLGKNLVVTMLVSLGFILILVGIYVHVVILTVGVVVLFIAYLITQFAIPLLAIRPRPTQPPYPPAPQSPPSSQTVPVPSPPGPATQPQIGATPQSPVCPRCGQPLMYVQQYQRWYCSAENTYP